MTTAIVQTEKRTCDFCNVREAYSFGACVGCGKDCCWECHKKSGNLYHAGVFFSGSGDGFYCEPCDNRLMFAGDELHRAYRTIHELREENSSWYERFEIRKKLAEEVIKTKLTQRKP